MPAGTRDKEDSESSEDEHEGHPCLAWCGLSRKIPVLVFCPEAIVSKDGNLCSVGERYHLAFKMVRTESRLVRGILTNHGFHEVHPNSTDFNLMWTGSHLKPYLLRSLQEFQRVNHFPKSYELTRKDRLYKNIQRMQQSHGFKNFHIIPQTFVLPAEYPEFCSSFAKDKGPWIIKPVASSRGRGIYLVSNPSQIPMEENILVSRYIHKPLLIDDFKFDVRLYVLVTSYEPLIIYLYEEGLARFATVKYDRAAKNIKNQFMHLTNYSVNKKSSDYVSCDDPEVEDYGNKWSMSAMLRYLKQEGKDTTLLMRQIEDLVIKAVVSAELQIATACKMFVPHRSNCFELYGFDVLIDSSLKPWLLEVNLSPSLACDAPLDLKIKASMISDMFSLVGFVCQDPLLRQPRSDRVTQDPGLKHPASRAQRPSSAQTAPAHTKLRQRPQSASTSEADGSRERVIPRQTESTLGLTTEEVTVLRKTKEQHERRGGFIRIFPTPDTWELYSGYLEYKTSMNAMLATRLFHGRSRSGNAPLHWEGLHVFLYERKLLSLEDRRRRKRRRKRKTRLPRNTMKGSYSQRRAPRELPAETSEEEEEEEEGDVEEEEKKQALGPYSQQEPPAREPAEQTSPAERLRTGALSSAEGARHSKPKVNLLNILQQDWNLSKVQARLAFSSYLQRVQLRLQSESSSSSSPAWPDKDDDQMELVMRFLRRASSNLQQDVRMVLPSRQLPLLDRRRLLAHQLGEFIHCYNKETEQMEQKEEEVPTKEEVHRCVNPSVFQEFVADASENDLEEVLTFYTHKNRSASVFLGTKARRTKMEPCFTMASGEPAQCSKHKCPPAVVKETSSASDSSVLAFRISADARHPNLNPAVEQPSDAPATHLYSQKLCRATSAGQVMKRTPSRSDRLLLRELEGVSGRARANQQALVSALQRLAHQHSSSPQISLLTQHLANMNLASGGLGRGAPSLSPSLGSTLCHQGPGGQGPVRAIHSIDKGLVSFSGSRPLRRASGENLVSGPVPQRPTQPTQPTQPAQPAQPSQGSYQLQFAIQQLQQQRLQSCQLLDHSRTRHQALLAGQPAPAFAASTIPTSSSSSSSLQGRPQGPHPPAVLAPKPPSGGREGGVRKTATQRLSSP
ncbi:tubulin polyglutamylase TTLL5 [Aplochiton taeniatus]